MSVPTPATARTPRKRAPRKKPTRLSAEDTAAGKLQRGVRKILVAQHQALGMLPTSGRFLWYECETDHLVTKELPPKRDGAQGQRKPGQNLTDAILHLREIGPNALGIPWEWIEDETREMHSVFTAPTVAEYIDEAVRQAKIARWLGMPAPLIICESRSLAGVLRATAELYACHITSTNGQTKGFLITDVVPMMEVGQRILYFGDLDLSGGHIEMHTRSVLIEYGGEAGQVLGESGIYDPDAKPSLRNPDGLWQRVSITARQAAIIERERARKGLPPATIRKPDNRFKPVRYFDAIETEAFGQARIIAALKTRLDELIPEPLADILAREEQQKADMRKLLAAAAKRQRKQSGQ